VQIDRQTFSGSSTDRLTFSCRYQHRPQCVHSAIVSLRRMHKLPKQVARMQKCSSKHRFSCSTLTALQMPWDLGDAMTQSLVFCAFCLVLGTLSCSLPLCPLFICCSLFSLVLALALASSSYPPYVSYFRFPLLCLHLAFSLTLPFSRSVHKV
jgi:hypothetical protein